MKRALIVLALLSVAGCATPPPLTPPAGLAASTAAPDIRGGDAWTYAFHDGYTRLPRGNVEYRVSAVQDDTVTVEVTHGGQQATEIYTRDWNWRARPMTNLQYFRYNPPYAALPFPLAAGKTWRAYTHATDPATGRVNRVRIDGSVLGWERVKVPAGEFDTIKIRRLVYAGNAEFFRTEENITEIEWYSPQLGQVVRRESHSHHLDSARGCADDGYHCMLINGDWNVLELVGYRRTGPRS